jgi:uncharacterized membrane protein YphA (DoxX/SURF4 family)
MSACRTAAYWATTAVLATECLAGGVMGALQLSPFRDTATHLGYPTYFMSILGIWYVSAGVVLLTPRLPRLKEWAYAGLVFNYTGAAASHLWVGDGAEKLVGPAVFLGLTAASWALWPPERRELSYNTAGFTRSRRIVYWIATVSVAGELAVGGVWDLMRIDYVRDVVEHLGYPIYLLTIMGIWKVPGAVALLIPRFPRLKEWAYAGAVINYASAAASHLIVGDGLAAIVAPMALLALTVTSWALHGRVVPGGVQAGEGNVAERDFADRDVRRPW